MNSYALCLVAYTTIMEDIHHIIIGIIVVETDVCIRENIFLDGDYEPTYVYDILFWEIYFVSVKIN